MNKKERITFSKKATTLILIVALIDLQICIFLNRETIAVTLITEIIGVFLVYSVKAYFGKKQEEKTRLEEDQANYERDFEKL